MKKRLSLGLSLIATIAFATSAFAGSLQVGEVSAVSVEADGAKFELNTSVDMGLDARASCLNAEGPISFNIPFTTLDPQGNVVDVPGAKLMYQTVMQAKLQGFYIQVNGDGNCVGVESEKAVIVNLVSPAP